ncbi:methyltransferase [Sulfurivirga sp.]|uniref:class I SAM-dependent methyltransferase n=1 Tax=Sulfurivirga sp. TaxID=2614236 RepID=UPI0025DC8E27|nr:methyltransferase [Sulfurivirga sp.]
MDARTIEQLKRDIVFEAELAGHRFTFHTTWGLFSPRQIDSGTALLLRYLDVRPDERALDIGCGYGPLGLSIAAQAPQGQVHMVDKDFVAVDYARANARRNGLNNVEAYLSNGLSHVPADARFTTVVSNIPAKVGKELLTILLWDSWQHLEPGGQMVVVTINGLRQFMKRHMLEIFGNYDKVKQGRDYTVSRAVRE